MQRYKWTIRRTSVDITALARQAGISGVLAKILINRNIKTKEEIYAFINPSLESLNNSLLMKDMYKGINIIKKAIEENKKIIIYGDYDADGVSSTVILYKTLTSLGANVSYWVPDRELEGYGMNSQRILKLKEDKCEVILTCDNGIAAIEQVKLAKSLGMEVVITDHHELPFVELSGEREYIVPEADAIINPKQKDCPYIFKNLCGAGIALKFSKCLYSLMGKENNNINSLVEIAAIGTICDVVDLIGENRIISKKGLELINYTSNIGIKALIKATGLENKQITSYHIGYILGPCINATGRLETADLAVELLLCNDEKKAKELAEKLYYLNVERQKLTNESVEKIDEIIQKSYIGKNKVFVIYKDDIHESIAGIVAGRIKEKYNLPVIILTKGKEMPKGSGRSIEGYNMFEELIKCKDIIEKFGGHPMAAGLSIKKENITKLRDTLNKNCTLTDEDLIPKVRIDVRIPLDKITYNTINDIKRLEPFGKGNSRPLFADKNIGIKKLAVIGKNRNVLKLTFVTISGKLMQGIYFGDIESFNNMIIEEYNEEQLLRAMDGRNNLIKVDITYFPAINEYMGNSTIQINVQNFRVAKNERE